MSHVEQIKARLGIVDVVSSYLKLVKTGSNYKAVCPFHTEKSPSFFVSPSRESFHCFGCEKSGDIFSFVMEIEGLDFSEALKVLASRAGIGLAFENPKIREEKNSLRYVLEESEKFYRLQLPKHPEVAEYLKNRGMLGESAKIFGVGFAPAGWRNLSDYLIAKGFNPAEIEKAGMSVKTEKGWYDRFRSRIMFPLKNGSGQIVGFSGRIFGVDDGGGKYVNSPQTELYDKSRILYGFDLAKQAIRENDACILVEGQMDVIMSHQAGVMNVAAVSGTAMSENHLALIKRLTSNILFSFDKDKAGFEASKRNIGLAYQNGFSVKAIVIPNGKDPADVVKDAPEVWKKAISEPADFIFFYLDCLAGANAHDRQSFIRETRELVLPYVASLENAMDMAYYVKEISSRLGLGEDSVWAEIRKITRESPLLKGYGEKAETENNPPPRIKNRRYIILLDRLYGLLAWVLKSEAAEVIEKAKEILEKKKAEFSSYKEDESVVLRLVFEAELVYSGMSPKNILAEISFLDKETEREMVREELFSVEEKMRLAESRKDESEIKKLLNITGELIKKLNAFSNEKI